MPANIGLTEIAVVLGIVLIIFGPKRLPELGRSMGRGIREFRGSLAGNDDDDDDAPRELSKGDATSDAGGDKARSETTSGT